MAVFEHQWHLLMPNLGKGLEVWCAQNIAIPPSEICSGLFLIIDIKYSKIFVGAEKGKKIINCFTICTNYNGAFYHYFYEIVAQRIANCITHAKLQIFHFGSWQLGATC